MSFADGGRPRHQIVRSHEVQELARPVRVAAERDADAGAAFRGARALLERMRRAGLRLVVASSTRAEELGQLLRIAGTDGLIKTTTSSRRRGPVEARPRRRRRRVGVRMIALRCDGWTDDALAGAVAIYDDPEDLLARYETSPLARPPSPRTNAIQVIPSTIRPHVPPRESPNLPCGR